MSSEVPFVRFRARLVSVLEIVDVIQGNEQVNDGQMIKGRVNPEQLRMERRGGNQLCCRFK